MSSWLTGGLKTSLSSLKDQVTNSIKDALEELEEDETDADLLDEESGRDASTRLLMAADRLRDVRQKCDDQKRDFARLKELYDQQIVEKEASVLIQKLMSDLTFHEV